MNRPPIPTNLRRQVLVEAGHRCAIPSCRMTTIEIAHIVPYSKVKEHKFENLIALCPNCHTRFDKGEIDKLSVLEYKANLRKINLHFLSDNNAIYDITLWTDNKNEDIVFNVQNNSTQPLLDFVLYVDKINKTELDLLKSPHTLEVVFGTIPANMTLTHIEQSQIFSDDFFGFPILSGQFSDKQNRHWAINENLNIYEIDFRAPFD
ncbi:MAG: HNH endonuclease signature motif containing protein [Candidatus Kapaibacterium sp.]